MTVLALDPSSTCVGYAVLDGPRSLLDAGRLTPARQRDDANARIRSMGADLRRLLAEHPAAAVVVEDTSGKVARHGRGRGMNGAGLAVYGKALGYLWAVVEVQLGRPPELVLENVWTRGVAKAARQRVVAMEYQSYAADRDPGGDVADAIALGRWWLVEGQHAAAAAEGR